MTLPTRNDKDYLTFTEALTGFFIAARRPHAVELEALFHQHGLPCQREADVGLGEDTLRFDASADRAQVETLLESYKTAKGS
jgi:hypothetical protein